MPGDPALGRALRPMVPDDLAMIAGWLDPPHARGGCGDPVAQPARVTGDLDQPVMDQQIASHRGTPFGYVQSFPAHAWPGGAPHLADFPPGTIAVDGFTGPAKMLGRGHGTAMMRLYARHLVGQGAPKVVIDPDPGKARAVRRAGFRDVALRRDDEGDMTLVMCLEPPHIFS